MSQQPAIERYFSTDREDLRKLADIYRDLQPVVRNVNSSMGEMTLQLREDYFDIYYQGNALAKVDRPRSHGKYVVHINNKFLVVRPWDAIPQPFEFDPGLSGLQPFCHPHGKDLYHQRFEVEATKLAWFFQKGHLEKVASNIRRVNNGEEITFEQLVMTDNPPRANFIIIDRQVREHGNRSQMDLLALARDDPSGSFHFLILELKLGRNKELEGPVAEQLQEYIARIRDHIGDYADCYEKNYAQKWDMGLFRPYADKAGLSSRINIARDPQSVEGLVVVGGYSQFGASATKKLKASHPNVKVLSMARRLNPKEAL